MTLEKAVAAKLAAQRGQEEAAQLWKKLWAAYEKGGVEGAQAALSKLLDDPSVEETEDA